MREFSVRTGAREEMREITAETAAAVRASGVASGICTLFVPHTTCALAVNENADPSVRRDILAALAAAVPRNRPAYEHAEGNSDAHAKAVLAGSSVSLPVEDGGLVLGTWQGVFLCEFDGPRTRRVLVRVAAG